MVLFQDIKGQSNALRYLSKSLSLGRVVSSYLFSGPRGVGRVLTAKAFITALICPNKNNKQEACGVCPTCRRISIFEHPDAAWIKPEKNKAIKIEEIRKVKELLSLKPYESPVNICVIEDAHMMTQEACNALLKVLEEPPGNSILILITDRKELLLPTVISRCTEVQFRPLSVEDTKDIIMEKVTDADEAFAAFLAYFSQGSPGRALMMIDECVMDKKNEVISGLNDFVNQEGLLCSNWKHDEKNILLEDLEMMIMFFRDIAVGKECDENVIVNKDIIGTKMYSFFKEYSTEKIYFVMERLIDIKTALLGNVNPKLAAQMIAYSV
ncbi:MAG: DNA polymerase III subunit delta' [Candidatus Omnitrophota bacterium]